MDSKLVDEGGYLVVYVPAACRAMVFRVVTRVNKGFEVIDYGPLPLRKGDVLAGYDGGSAVVPEDGVMPPRSYVPPSGVTFPMPGAFDETDMWYVPSEWGERLFHVVLSATPGFLRLDVAVPRGVVQGRFQRDKVTTGLEKGFGYTRGEIEVVHLPGIHYGYRFGNDTNLAVHTGARFTYAEYVVEIPRSPELVFDILTKRVPARWVTLQLNVYDETVRRALLRAYGIEGLQLYDPTRRGEALSEYAAALGQVRA